MLNILKAEIGYKPKLTNKELEKMDLYDVLQDDRDFKIIANSRTFFHEPLFPILELVQYCKKWNENPDADFIYNTIESEENPILAFKLHDYKWNIYSVWQKFECDEAYSFNEVYSFVREIINQVIQ